MMSEAELRRAIADATEAWCKTMASEDLTRLHTLRAEYHRMLGMEGTVSLSPSPVTSSTSSTRAVREVLTA